MARNIGLGLILFSLLLTGTSSIAQNAPTPKEIPVNWEAAALIERSKALQWEREWHIIKIKQIETQIATIQKRIKEIESGEKGEKSR